MITEQQLNLPKKHIYSDYHIIRFSQRKENGRYRVILQHSLTGKVKTMELGRFLVSIRDNIAYGENYRTIYIDNNPTNINVNNIVLEKTAAEHEESNTLFTTNFPVNVRGSNDDESMFKKVHEQLFDSIAKYAYMCNTPVSGSLKIGDLDALEFAIPSVVGEDGCSMKFDFGKAGKLKVVVHERGYYAVYIIRDNKSHMLSTGNMWKPLTY